MWCKSRAHIIGVQECNFCRFLESFRPWESVRMWSYGTHHFDVCVRDEEDACRPEGCCGLRLDTLGCRAEECILDGMTWEIWRQMRFTKIRKVSQERSTLQLGRLLVRLHHEECRICGQISIIHGVVRLMKIEMTNIDTKISGTTQSNLQLVRAHLKQYLSIHIRAIHINLSTILVYNFANSTNPLLKHTKSTGIRNHNRRQLVLVISRLFLQILHIEIPLIIALDSNNVHSCHGCGSWVCPVCRDRDEADISMFLTSRFMVCANDPETSQFSLSAGVLLQRNLIETCNGFEILGKFLLLASQGRNGYLDDIMVSLD